MKAETRQRLSIIIISIQHGLEYTSQCNEIGKEIHKKDKKYLYLKFI